MRINYKRILQIIVIIGISAGFIVALCAIPTQIGPLAHKCKLHHVKMLRGTIPIEYGYVVPLDDNLARVENVWCPNANEWSAGGCVVDANSPKTTVDWYCQICRDEEKRLWDLYKNGCPVHHVRMLVGTAKLNSVIRSLLPDYSKAINSLFPYANDEVSNFNLKTMKPGSQNIEVLYCPECRRAKAKWLQEHKY
jgi:hypothetical protein